MLSDVRTQLRSKTLLENPSHTHKVLIIMIYYIRSLAVHSAMLSYVLISTVSCSPLCHALTCTRTYSPLRSTLPCSHMYSYIQSLAVHSAIPCGPLCRALLCTQIAQMAEYLRNPPVAWLVASCCDSLYILPYLHGRLCSTKYHPLHPVDHHYNALITIIDYGQELKHWTSMPFWKCTFSEYFLLRKFVYYTFFLVLFFV